MVARVGAIKNPLRRRWIRELKGDKGKYIALFLFLMLTIGFIAGFLVADDSMKAAYDKSFEKYKVEDGHFALEKPLDENLKGKLEEAGIRVKPQFFKDEDISKKRTVRLYRKRDDINKSCLMEGRRPKAGDEIAIDRLFAANNKLRPGDSLEIDGHEYRITGFVALSDYSALFRNNSDMMFNAAQFTVAEVTDEGFRKIGNNNLVYRYVWKDVPGKKVKTKKVESLLKESDILTDYVRRKDNKAITFSGDDMGGDRSMFLTMLYIVIVIMAFVFGITTKGTIEQEAGTIGTLRASGYTRMELLLHYLKLPVLVVLVAAVIGNVMGYTWMKHIVVDMYYNSYSLTKYRTVWSSDAFVQTTAIPVLIILVVVLLMLASLLSLPPLQFLRNELSRTKKKKAIPLPPWSFINRFRFRVIIQNRMAYFVLALGMLLASLLLLFGMGMTPLMEHFRSDVTQSQISKYQYILKEPIKTKTKGAEKYFVTTFRHEDIEDVTMYGIEKGTKYLGDLKLPTGKHDVVISCGYAEKYRIKKGDTITLSQNYGTGKYKFRVADIYDYPAAHAVFLERESMCRQIWYPQDYYNGYFSDRKIKDIDEGDIASIITLKDLTLVSDQLQRSFGSVLPMFLGFALIIYVLLLYLLTKMVVDKNKVSISMLKILGYTGREAGRIYNNATALVVVLSLLITLPLSEKILKILYYIFMKRLNGWLTYYLPGWLFVFIPVMGMVCYGLMHVFLSRKVSRIQLAVALKNME